jgi:hypothetical protein
VSILVQNGFKAGDIEKHGSEDIVESMLEVIRKLKPPQILIGHRLLLLL